MYRRPTGPQNVLACSAPDWPDAFGHPYRLSAARPIRRTAVRFDLCRAVVSRVDVAQTSAELAPTAHNEGSRGRRLDRAETSSVRLHIPSKFRFDDWASIDAGMDIKRLRIRRPDLHFAIPCGVMHGSLPGG